MTERAGRASRPENRLGPDEALAHWDRSGPVSPAPDAGLINRTWLVGSPPSSVLQRVHELFDPRIQIDIDAVTRRLSERHLPTPRLLRTRTGDLWVPDGPAAWRLMTFVPGRTLHRLPNARIAASAGDLVGRFHAALRDFDHTFRAPRRFAHDTPTRMGRLRKALAGCESHPQRASARELGEEILRAWSAWNGELDLPGRICHGDLKVSNLRFAGSGDLAVCLIDLDTVGPMSIVEEMGDAWRSWCNPAGEDAPDRADFDLSIFEASARAWATRHGPVQPLERHALAGGIERICLELAGRFCADAVLHETFAEDRARWPEPGHHNLLRARGQLKLARAVADRRGEIERIVDDLRFG